MIILNSTNKSLELVLSGAVATTELDWTISYVDITTTAFTPIATSGTSNGTTDVTIMAAPAASTQRQLKHLAVYNADTDPVDVTIQYNDNTNIRKICTITLAVGYQLLINSEGEISVYDTDGKYQSAGGGGGSGTVTPDSVDTFTNKTIDADGAGNSITNIENADIKAAAAIALDKLAATTVSRALVSDASGFISAATTTSTEIGYVNGVTSAIQTQLDAKITTSSTDTLTNKTINADGTGNVITNIGSSEVKSELISGMGSVSAATGDTVLIGDASDSNNLKKCTVDSIVALASGSSAAAGTSIQTVSTTLTTTVSLSHTSSTGFADVTGLSQAITPASSSNKVLVSGFINLGCGTSATPIQVQIVRTSTAIGIGTSVSSRVATTTTMVIPATDDDMMGVPFQFLDSPATTSSTTYKIQITQKATGSSVNLYVNRSAADTDSISYPRGASTITLTEIKG